jgi:hypothetical protein
VPSTETSMLATPRSHVTALHDDDEALTLQSDDSTTIRPQHRITSTPPPVTNDTHCDDSDDQLLIPDISGDCGARCSTELGDGEPSSQQDLHSSPVARECEQDISELWSR